MSKPISDDTAVLRLAIQQVLASAKAPMTSQQIAEHQEIVSLGLPDHRNKVAITLVNMYDLKKRGFRLCRVPTGQGRTKWEWYNPDVLPHLMFVPPKMPAPVNPVKSAPLNPVIPPGFEFNPVDFAVAEPDPVPDAPYSEPVVPVQVPVGVKSITLSVAGVTIKIELN